MKAVDKKMQWKISVPIFKQSLILKQLGLAIGIPIGILIFILVFVFERDRNTVYALSLIGLLFFITWLFIMVVYGGKYQVEFSLDAKGIYSKTQENQQKKNKLVNGLTVFLGLLSGKPAVAGAGTLAQSRQQVFLPWKQVTKVKYSPPERTILIKCGWVDSVALFCTKDNFSDVQEFVKSKIILK